MTRLALRLFLVVAILPLACSQSTPPVDTPATLPPAEPPADVTRTSAEKGTTDEPTVERAADAGKPDQQTDAKPVEKP